MVRANEPIRLARGFCADQGTAMPADVVQCMENVAVTANDNNGIGVHFDREVLSPIANLTRMPGKEPTGAPDPLQIEPVDFFIRKELTRERLARWAPCDERFDSVFHGRSTSVVPWR